MTDRTTVLHTAPALGTPVRRISWGSVLAGVTVALMVQVLLNLLLLGLGFTTVDPATEQNPFAGVGTGAVVGLILVNLLALFAGGVVAGRLAGAPRTFEALMHGLLVWALLTLLSFFLLTSAVGRVFNGVTSAVGQGFSLIGQGVSAVAPEAAQAVQDQLEAQNVSLEGLRQEARDLLADTEVVEGEGSVAGEAQEAAEAAGETAVDVARNPQQAAREIDSLLTRLASSTETITDSAERQDLVEALRENSNLSQEEAETTVDGWLQTLEEGRQQLEQVQAALTEAAETATDALGTAALWAFVALVLGAAVAAVGGYVGSPDDVLEARAA